MALAPNTLQSDLIHAENRRNRLRHQLDAFELALEQIQLPAHRWRDSIHKRLRTLELRFYQADRQFHRSRRLIATETVAQAKPTINKNSKPAQEHRPTQIVPITLRQAARIEVIDGQTITKIIDTESKWFVENQSFDEGVRFCRTLEFPEGIVPPEYAYAATHNGETFSGFGWVFIYYSKEEFIRICQQELDTQSPHLLDGERLDYKRRNLPPAQDQAA